MEVDDIPAFEDTLLPVPTASATQNTTSIAVTDLEPPKNDEEDEGIHPVGIEDDEKFDAIELHQAAADHLDDERSDDNDNEAPPHEEPATHTQVADFLIRLGLR